MNIMRWNERQPIARLLLPLAVAAALGVVNTEVRAQGDLSISGGVTVIGQAISDDAYATNGAAEVDDEGNRVYPDANGAGITYSFDIAFEKELESGTVFINLVGAEGNPVFDGGNADAEEEAFVPHTEDGRYPSIGVTEAWYEHKMFDEMLAFTIGKLDPTGHYDGSEVANDPATQFLADAFVNNPAILFPDYTPGMNLSLALGEVVSLSAGMFEDADANIPGEFEQVFFISELGLHYELFDAPGNFRLDGWNSGANDRSGVAFNLDQGFGDDFIAIFSRLGFVFNTDTAEEAEPETELAFSIGARLNFGDGHSFALAYGLDSPQVDVDPEGNALGSISWFETYLDFAVTEDFHTAFDLQFIANPEYRSDYDTLALFGFRVQVEF